MGGPDTAGGSLKHYGVKGMKWGVHRDTPSGGSSTSRAPRASEDSRAATSALNKAATRGTQSLSNKELQAAIQRMNLENQYHNLTTVSKQNELDRGLETTKRILKLGKTVEEIRKFSKTETGQAVVKGLKIAFGAGKVAAAAYTGGASGAAAAGAGLAIRRMQNR